MGWLRVLDIPFDILASLLYRSTRHSLPGRTNMPPRAPRVATVAKTHATTVRVRTHCTGHATQVASQPSPYGKPGSPAAAA